MYLHGRINHKPGNPFLKLYFIGSFIVVVVEIEEAVQSFFLLLFVSEGGFSDAQIIKIAEQTDIFALSGLPGAFELILFDIKAFKQSLDWLLTDFLLDIFRAAMIKNRAIRLRDQRLRLKGALLLLTRDRNLLGHLRHWDQLRVGREGELTIIGWWLRHRLHLQLLIQQHFLVILLLLNGLLLDLHLLLKFGLIMDSF